MWYKVSMKQHIDLTRGNLYYTLAQTADNELLLLDILPSSLRVFKDSVVTWHIYDDTSGSRAIDLIGKKLVQG